MDNTTNESVERRIRFDLGILKHLHTHTVTATWTVRGLSPAERLTLMAIAEHSGAHGRDIWPSTKRISYMTELSRPTVSKAIKSLQEKGFITSTARYNGRGQTSNNYHLTYYDEYVKNLTPQGVSKTLHGVTSGYRGGVTSGYTEPTKLEPNTTPPFIPPQGGEEERQKVEKQQNQTTAPREKNQEAKTAKTNTYNPKDEQLPPNLPEKDWFDWVEHRIKKGMPLDKSTAERFLGKFRAAGENAAAMIDQAICGNYSDVRAVSSAYVDQKKQEPKEPKMRGPNEFGEFLPPGYRVVEQEEEYPASWFTKAKGAQQKHPKRDVVEKRTMQESDINDERNRQLELLKEKGYAE